MDTPTTSIDREKNPQSQLEAKTKSWFEVLKTVRSADELRRLLWGLRALALAASKVIGPKQPLLLKLLGKLDHDEFMRAVQLIVIQGERLISVGMTEELSKRVENILQREPREVAKELESTKEAASPPKPLS